MYFQKKNLKILSFISHIDLSISFFFFPLFYFASSFILSFRTTYFLADLIFSKKFPDFYKSHILKKFELFTNKSRNSCCCSFRYNLSLKSCRLFSTSGFHVEVLPCLTHKKLYMWRMIIPLFHKGCFRTLFATCLILCTSPVWKAKL